MLALLLCHQFFFISVYVHALGNFYFSRFLYGYYEKSLLSGITLLLGIKHHVMFHIIHALNEWLNVSL